MKNGCVVCGGVGSGKSLTAISYYYLENGGEVACLQGEDYIPMDDPPMDLYIITTARKRDTFEWEKELAPFLLSTTKETNLYGNKVVVDSWNNVHKYTGVENAFFIFDEQRVIGSGVWVKSFLKIARRNRWILCLPHRAITGAIIFRCLLPMDFTGIAPSLHESTSYILTRRGFRKSSGIWARGVWNDYGIPS